MKRVSSLFLIFLFLSLSAIYAGCYRDIIGGTNDPLVVETKYGLVKGQEDKNNTIVWKAIPFAKPPVEDLRWKAPRDPDSWSGVREKTEFCDICPQYTTDPNNISIVTGIGGSEDCLYLNIWRPNTADKFLPVYFWIHGGGNSIQLPRNSDLSGANLASRNNMVVISINYRLGPLGWLTHPALRTGSAYDNSGNYGTLDIIKALKWVKENIWAFGGNPCDVTVAGESAGGFDIFSLIISNVARGIFQRAIVESGAAKLATIADGETYAQGIIIKLLIKDGKASDVATAMAYLANMSNADVAGYLRSKSSPEIISLNSPSSGAMVFFPNLFPDGVVLPSNGYATLDDGTYPNKVPIVIGSNKYETKLFLFSAPQFITVILGIATPEVRELYMLANKYMSNLWTAGLDAVARKMAKYQKHVYVYRFNWGSGVGADSVIPYPYNYALGGCHGSEIQFFFGNVDDTTGSLGRIMFTPQNSPGRFALSNAIMDYLGKFARIGDPSCRLLELPVWAEWSNQLTGAPKGIKLDANLTDIQIEMSDEEFTVPGIMTELQSEPRANEIMQVMQQFSAFLL
ncbi:MAG: hypothetical protein A2W19_05705 [Spirochaetes bacterium RBG_16_49_21]|nr:MAG: hypothetical protein A2W19_05705 [Spirochaetes bacterium RBG_16_49_21]